MPDHLLIVVNDQDRKPPVLQEPSENGEGGRGFRLVAGLSAAWGYTYPNPPVGKSVWAKVLIAHPTQEVLGDVQSDQSARSQKLEVSGRTHRALLSRPSMTAVV